MKNKKIALQIMAMSLILLSFIACDEEFATLESDIINEENAMNFDILSQQYDIITYTQVLGPVQTDGLALNSLGIYDDSYGRTTSSILTQLNASSYDPTFGEQVAIDSVVLTIPYFSSISEIDDDNIITYNIDSVIGREPIKLRLFESNYFIRDFDPNGEFNDNQNYYSNMSASTTETISNGALESTEIGFVEYDEDGNITPIDNIIQISEEGYTLTEPDNDDDDTEPQVLQRLSPGIRVKLDTTFWRNKIIDKEGEPVLSSQNNFSEYFRGLYFKAEPINDKGSFLISNLASEVCNVTIYYTSLTASTTDDADATEQNTFVMTFGPNRINFMDNNFTNPIENGNSETGDSRLYLKGGEGSLSRIKLFNGDDIDEDNDTFNSFETFKNAFVETDEDGNFVRSKRLINEANLVFYVDQDAVETPTNMQDGEPNRIYLYEIENKAPLIDFDIDITNSSLPSFSKFNHLGPLQRVDDEPNGNGIKYKIKITEHINDLIVRDSTNVELGLAVCLNVNLEESFLQRNVLSLEDTDLTAPISSILSPRGTILHGNNTEDENKKVYLEIYYTEPNN
ncbi:DUF4270 domain-containing protein [uncultured Winogradskyella sp.]|uniref:DUF4270 domain-containing protein n=1 Tax=uncultured Winogradskyella sp. TaxID=395353 RepID=UPI0026352F77|nr:DUF4270 domain-containing protein [uncultured Winogradskyella sp.]